MTQIYSHIYINYILSYPQVEPIYPMPGTTRIHQIMMKYLILFTLSPISAKLPHR
jgi:hypothetical protein